MWMSGGVQPNWIQYQFDKVYKLHELWVWNTNQVIESVVSFGAKGVKIEYSTDGGTWTELPGVPEPRRRFAGYTHNTTVDLVGGFRKCEADDRQHLGWSASGRFERSPVLPSPCRLGSLRADGHGVPSTPR
jgi:hypothetical protein